MSFLRRPAELETPLRETLLRQALGRILKFGQADNELLVALGRLHAQTPDPANPSIILAECLISAGLLHWEASSGAGAKPVALPRLDPFLHWVCEIDGFGVQSVSMVDLANWAKIPSSTFEQPKTLPVPMALARSPLAESIGLLLNEARPESAAAWPLLCAFAGAPAALRKRLAANAPPLADRSIRDEAIALACEARDAQLLGIALAAMPTDPPSSAAWGVFADALATSAPKTSVRRALGCSGPASPPGDLVALIARIHPDKAFSDAMLEAACVDQVGGPDAVNCAAWEGAKKTFAEQGSTLRPAGHLAVAKKAIAACATPFGPRQAIPGRAATAEDLDAIAAGCVKQALGMGQQPPSAAHPPIAFLVLELLADAGPQARRRIVAAMDKWCESGFGREQLRWRRGAAGQTQSIGSAIAGLPRTKSPAMNFEAEISRWLTAIAKQGFDFEAKATPKSKSLGERMRTSAGLRAFWPLVEAQALGLEAKQGAAPGKPRSL